MCMLREKKKLKNLSIWLESISSRFLISVTDLGPSTYKIYYMVKKKTGEFFFFDTFLITSIDLCGSESLELCDFY